MENTFINGICTNHNDKMEHMASYSTNCQLCPTCKARHENGNYICSVCYSWKMITRFKALRDKLTRNTEHITSHILEDYEIPFLNCAFFRFEAFGEIMNTTQVINYFKVAEKNGFCRFALWSKNPHIIAQAIEQGYEKPSNLNIIYSAEVINMTDSEALAKIAPYDFIDAVFIVYTKAYAEEHNIIINCGFRKCVDCLRCYRKISSFVIIRELEK